MVIAIVPAAGCGRRLDATLKKQYLLLDGVPIVVRTLAVFQRHPLVDQIFLVVPHDERAFCQREMVSAHHLTKVVQVVSGGAERQDSVANGLAACMAQADDIVVIHDGVRPFLSADTLSNAIEAATAYGAAVVGVPVKDTVKEVCEGTICSTPARERLWLAQTPQAFRAAVLHDAYEQAARTAVRATDDASLVELAGYKVHMVLGSYRNIKITTLEDLIVARALLRAKKER